MICWTKPPVGWLKVNTDAAFVASSGESGIGYIIRDYMGRLLRAESVKLLAYASVEEAEACACVTGLKAALTLGNGKIIVESDCAAVISNILSRATPLVAWREHYILTRELLQTRPDIVFRKIGREGNKRAHELAKLSQISGRGRPL
ncbi:Ubiquitin carboxyl-terminal hydrolase 2 [Hordeum vulgare]|nr:Ubiquitin carboxyl-terminal hydrolase 2 [Hordeum vulgare]